MSDLYTTRTASLRATKGDFNKIILKNKNILDYINEATPTVKHAQDTRETVTENDLWGQYIETKDDGTIIVHDNEVTNPNASNNSAWDTSITRIEDNKAYVGNTYAVHANIQTEKIKDGDRMFYYCDNLTTFTSDLSSLTDGSSMFNGCSSLTTFKSGLDSLADGSYMFAGCTNLTTFTSDSSGAPVNLSSLTNGYYMFRGCSNLTSFTSDLPSLADGSGMFNNCTNLTTFTADLSSLTNGSGMFRYCTNLTTFTSDLSSLTSCNGMFNGCSKLAIFNSDLSSLSSGRSMFGYCSNLTTFTSNSSGSPVNLSSLADGYMMFKDCFNLTTFTSDLSSLVDGYYMFAGCTNLTAFTSDLSSLINGGGMLSKTKLAPQSVMFIADSIKDITAEKQLYANGTIPYVTTDENYKYSAPIGFMSNGKYVYTYKIPQPYTTEVSASEVGKLTLGINVTNNAETIQQQLEDFAQEATFDSWDVLKTYFSNKGWTVTFQYGGSPDVIPNEFPNTYDLRNGEQIIPCPIFAKLVQVEDKDSGKYCTEDASTFYNIEWGHDVTDTSSYTQFDSLEDAMASWNVFPKENIITAGEEA